MEESNKSQIKRSKRRAKRVLKMCKVLHNEFPESRKMNEKKKGEN